jgi:hypothetical protein
MSTERQDIHRTDGITRASGSALGTPVDPAVHAPLPAYRACLRGIGFAESDRASRLVIQQLDDLACADATHLLSLLAPDALGRVVERLADVAQRAGEGFSHLACSLVAQVTNASLGLIEHAILAPLQSLVAPRAFDLACLRLLDFGKLLVAVLDGCLGSVSADEDDLLPVGGGNQGVDAKVYTDDGLLRARRIRDFTGQAHCAIGEARFHEASWHCDGIRQPNPQGAALAVRQHQPPITDTRILVGVDHIMVAQFAPRVTCLGLPIAAQLAAGVYRLAELADDLLRALCGQARIAPLWPNGPPLPARLAGPLPAQAADAVMPHEQIIPQPRGLSAAGSEGGPFGGRVWFPRNLYCAIAHANSMPDRYGACQAKSVALAGCQASLPTAKAGDPQPEGR